MSVLYVVRSARKQISIETAAFHEWTLPDGTEWTSFYRQGSAYLLRFPGLADFEVSSDGSNVQGWPVPGVSPQTVEHLHLNQVLPLALSRQGQLVLHGSAIDVGGRGVAFVGESGRGKSTLAASFATSGGRFLTDDGLHLQWVSGVCQIIPSHPSIRLWEDSQSELTSANTIAAPALDFTSKARLLAGADIAFCVDSLPLRRVYFLGTGDAESVAIEVMKPAAALIELLRNSFLLDIDERHMLALHFDELCRLANLPIYYHLDYRRRYEDLSYVRDAITRHASKLESCT